MVHGCHAVLVAVKVQGWSVSAAVYGGRWWWSQVSVVSGGQWCCSEVAVVSGSTMAIADGSMRWRWSGCPR